MLVRLGLVITRLSPRPYVAGSARNCRGSQYPRSPYRCVITPSSAAIKSAREELRGKQVV